MYSEPQLLIVKKEKFMAITVYDKRSLLQQFVLCKIIHESLIEKTIRGFLFCY